MSFLDIFRSEIAIMQQLAEKENDKLRGICPPTDGVSFMNARRDVDAATLVSGGSQEERLWVIYNRIRNALRRHYSVVSIICPEVNAYHTEALMRPSDKPVWTGTICFDDGTQYGFDPLLSAPPRIMATILARVSAGISGDHRAKSDYWRFALDLLVAVHGQAKMKDLLELDFQMIPDQLRQWLTEGKLNAASYQDLISRYDETLSVQAAAANDLCSLLLPMEKCLRAQNVGMDALLKRRGVMVLDMILRSNHAAIDLILLLVEHLAPRGQMMFVIDGIDCPVSDSIRTNFFSASEAAIPVVLGGDLPALMGPIFDRLAGNRSFNFVFSHSSGASAEKWSVFFGTYPKKIVEYSVDDNKRNTSVVERNRGRNVSVRIDENSRKITEDQIQKLDPGTAYVRRPGASETDQVVCPRISLARMKEKLVCSRKN